MTIDEDYTEICPECGGEVACECTKEYMFRCIEQDGIWIGCGWTGEECDYRPPTEEELQDRS